MYSSTKEVLPFLSLWAPFEFCLRVPGAITKWLLQEVKQNTAQESTRVRKKRGNLNNILGKRCEKQCRANTAVAAAPETAAF